MEVVNNCALICVSFVGSDIYLSIYLFAIFNCVPSYSAGRYTCHCNAGYEISPLDSSKCQDRDECSDGHRGGCDHLCTNTS